MLKMWKCREVEILKNWVKSRNKKMLYLTKFAFMYFCHAHNVFCEKWQAFKYHFVDRILLNNSVR